MDENIKNKLNEKKATFTVKAKEKGTALANWCIDHPVQASAITALIARVVRTAMKEHRYQKEEYARRTREYDPSIGMYYDLRRPLTNKEKVELSKRHKRGESIGDILSSFNVL